MVCCEEILVRLKVSRIILAKLIITVTHMAIDNNPPVIV
jgi:hypothetical protein